MSLLRKQKSRLQRAVWRQQGKSLFSIFFRQHYSKFLIALAAGVIAGAGGGLLWSKREETRRREEKAQREERAKGSLGAYLPQLFGRYKQRVEERMQVGAEGDMPSPLLKTQAQRDAFNVRYRSLYVGRRVPHGQNRQHHVIQNVRFLTNFLDISYALFLQQVVQAHTPLTLYCSDQRRRDAKQTIECWMKLGRTYEEGVSINREGEAGHTEEKVPKDLFKAVAWYVRGGKS